MKMFVKHEGEKIPIVMIGTSPFIGAGQFGMKSIIWRNTFLNDSKKMYELFKDANEKGAKGVEVIPVGGIIDAVSMMIEEHNEYSVLGSTGWDLLKIDELSNINSKIIFVHGSISDRRDRILLEDISKKIRKKDIIPGIATHEPLKTIPFLIESKLDFSAVLLPFNKEGYLMGNKKGLEKIVDKTGDELFYVGMKTLASGKIKPEIAYEYVSNHKISAVVVGLTNKKEISETVPIALDLLK